MLGLERVGAMFSWSIKQPIMHRIDMDDKERKYKKEKERKFLKKKKKKKKKGLFGTFSENNSHKIVF